MDSVGGGWIHGDYTLIVKVHESLHICLKRSIPRLMASMDSRALLATLVKVSQMPETEGRSNIWTVLVVGFGRCEFLKEWW